MGFILIYISLKFGPVDLIDKKSELNRRQTIIRTNDDIFHWRVSLGLNELMSTYNRRMLLYGVSLNRLCFGVEFHRFEIAHKIFCPYIERGVFHTDVKLQRKKGSHTFHKQYPDVPIHFLSRPTTAQRFPDSKVHGANMGPTWVLSAPDRPHVGPMNLAIWVYKGCHWTLHCCWANEIGQDILDQITQNNATDERDHWSEWSGLTSTM